MPPRDFAGAIIIIIINTRQLSKWSEAPSIKIIIIIIIRQLSTDRNFEATLLLVISSFLLTYTIRTRT